MSTCINYEVIEGLDDEATDQDYYDSLQLAINSLTAWRLQGSYGRAMMDAIAAGYCMLGKESTSDYWGNRIPSRDEVKAGTKGSKKFVLDRMGRAYANAMAKL